MAFLTKEEAVREATAYFPLAKSMAKKIKERRPHYADDIDSDVYIMLVHFLMSYDSDQPSQIPSYIRNIFKYRLIDYENKTFYKGIQAQSLEFAEDAYGNMGEEIVLSKEKDPADAVEAQDSFEDQMLFLHPTERRVMRLYIRDDLDMKTVAKICNRSVYWVFQIVRHAIKILRGEAQRKFPAHWRTVRVGRRFDSVYNWSKDPRCVVNYSTLMTRINDQKMEPLKAMVTPLLKNPHKSRQIMLNAFGETKSVRQWLQDPRCKVDRAQVIFTRIKNGMGSEKALTAPPGKEPILFNAFGESKNLSEWGKDPRCAVSYQALYGRIHRDKMPFIEALTLQRRPMHRWSKGTAPLTTGYAPGRGEDGKFKSKQLTRHDSRR